MAIEQKKGVKAEPAGSPGEQTMEQRRAFLKETWTELKKTTWPTKEEGTRLTAVVFGVIVAVALFMGALDAILSFLVQKFSLIK